MDNVSTAAGAHVAPSEQALPRVAPAVTTIPRIAYLDNIRYLMVVLVVLYHAVAAYAAVAPSWAIHDATSPVADVVRLLGDVFFMPVLFFVSGYFALASLQKKGAWSFLKDKALRIAIPWVLAVLVLLPLALYYKSDHVLSFRDFWPSYLGSFEVHLRFTQAEVGLNTQGPYWFLSLLFAFFVLLAAGYVLNQRLRRSPAGQRTGQIAARWPNAALLLFGLLIAAGYLLSLLCVPDSSWFTLHMFLEFQVTRLVLYGGYFALGVYARSRGWLGHAASQPARTLVLWSAAGVILAGAYLVVGQPVFADTAGMAALPVGLLIAFAFIRSYLLLSVLVVLVLAGSRYWNRSTPFDRQLSDTSYNIYLAHFWFVIFAQEALFEWTGGPVVAKMGIAFGLALALSYAISRWVLARHGRAFAAVLLALFVFFLARP